MRRRHREEVAALTAGIKQAEELVNSTREAAWKAEQTAAELQAAAAELAKEADVAGRLLELESELAHDQHDKYEPEHEREELWIEVCGIIDYLSVRQTWWPESMTRRTDWPERGTITGGAGRHREAISTAHEA